ncbi:Retrovirus-related Pol polyprotein like [Argiope bruennichi]|uniref:Retrovirus-related Pol polyprotein like n=1 Tax=Argiope bruennichi TaxID=94029 RepID=A0A8T0FD01_ARGBR|nr:Retrovirus-related Pol polyprotein like [Argiope bruennichi]
MTNVVVAVALFESVETKIILLFGFESLSVSRNSHAVVTRAIVETAKQLRQSIDDKYVQNCDTVFTANSMSGLDLFAIKYKHPIRVRYGNCLINSVSSISFSFTPLSGKIQPTFKVSNDLEQFLVDSAATSHFCCERDWFKNFRELSPNKTLLADKRHTCEVKGVGDIDFVIKDIKGETISVLDVVYKGETISVLDAVYKGETISVLDVVYKGETICVLEKMHMDLWGPAPVNSLGGIFRKYLSRVERELGLKLKSVRTDNSMEFCHQEFEKFLRQLGIKSKRRTIFTPELNGVSERFNRSSMDAVKTLLQDRGYQKLIGINCNPKLRLEYLWVIQ